MKNLKISRAVCVLAVLLLSVVPSTAETIAGGYTVGTKNYDLIKGVFYFPSAVAVNNTLSDIPARFFYSDGFFAEDPYTYNNHLATASMCMAMSAFYSNEGDYPTKRKNIIQYMKNIGVAESDIYANRYNTIKPQSDSIGVTIGMKRLTDGGILIPIAIRGSNYELEWMSNVTIGESGETKGFGEAAGKVFREVQSYIARKNLQAEIASGNVVFWVAGYSRAGATTNLTAKRLVDTYSAAGNKIFAYGLETPMGAISSEEKSGSNYSCIHSVINPADLVPKVAPAVMGFKRYGVDHYIPGSSAGTVQTGLDGNKYDNTSYKTTSAEYQTVRAKMITQLSAVNPNITFTDSFMVLGLGLNETMTGYTLTPGESVAMEDYLDEFITYFPALTGLTRTVYTGGAGAISSMPIAYGNIQRAFRALMSLLYGGSADEQGVFMALFLSQFLTSGTDTLIELAAPFFNAFREWFTPTFSYKAMYINRIINFFERRNLLDALSLTYPEKEKLLRAEFPIVLNLILTLATADVGTPLHGTLGFTQIATLLGNIGNVGMNHYPEVTFSWLRAQDSLYENETVRVSAMPAMTFSATASHVEASATSAIIDIDSIPDYFAVHGATPATQLPSTIAGTNSNGETVQLAVTWGSPKIYVIDEKLNGDTWKETDETTSSFSTKPLLYVYDGTVSYNGARTSFDVTANVYVAGLPRVNPPYTALPEGEYNGPQSIVLRPRNDSDGIVEYRISRFASSDTGTNIPYTGPITIGGEVKDSAVEYAVVARVSTLTITSEDSAELVWYYKINPTVSDDTTSEYVSNAASEIFTLTNETAVCWSVDVPAGNVSFTPSNANTGLKIFMTPSNANTIPTKRVDVAVVTVPGTTQRGIHTINVKTSANGGDTWTNDDPIKFDTAAKHTTSLPGSSSGSCNMSFSALGLMFALSFIIRKHKAS